jgi:hypothetical protein
MYHQAIHYRYVLARPLESKNQFHQNYVKFMIFQSGGISISASLLQLGEYNPGW